MTALWVSAKPAEPAPSATGTGESVNSLKSARGEVRNFEHVNLAALQIVKVGHDRMRDRVARIGRRARHCGSGRNCESSGVFVDGIDGGLGSLLDEEELAGAVNQ